MTRRNITFDTGALIALERNDVRIRAVLRRALEQKLKVTVPVVVVLEWWRGAPRQRLCLERLEVQPLTDRVAQLAGEAIAKLGATPIDAAVMASAADRGDVVYTSDVEDLQRLQTCFPNVRLMRATG